MIKRIATAVVLIPTVLLLVLRAPAAWVTLVTAAIALLTVQEFLKLTESYGVQPLRRPTYAFLLLFFLLLMINAGQEKPLLSTEIFGIAAAFAATLAAFVFLTIAMRREDQSTGYPAAAASAFAFVYIALPLAMLVQLRQQWAGAFLILYLLFLVWAGDILAYFVGRSIGRHLMAPRISPKKTWEGAVASMVGGLGVGAAKTTDAIMKLPPAVTLAFTPYGSDPGKLVERARAQHHEVLLQIPMEPFDYPDNDPGPQTLLTTLAAEQNLDRLYWHLSRFQGYAGIANFMGARFVVSDNVMQPIVREAAKRGLGYFDDGSAPRSVAPSLAAGQAMPFAKADLAIDAVPTALEIDRALARLESLARERGLAVGMASALPVSIERIAAWSKALDSRGVLLVPLTTAMLKSKSG